MKNLKLGAQFGQVNGWERPNYFAKKNFNDFDSEVLEEGNGGIMLNLKQKL